ncbi:MAG: thymidylate kinase [Planctomycetes bacterium]|nr:thymidylate kinase [Planctomycetota bacterium]
MLIALEGIDGSGKGTQARRLVDRLRGEGRKVAAFSFPRYAETFFGRAVGDFLNGRFGSLDAVDPFLAAVLFAGDRYESRELLLRAAAEHDVVVLDRYVPSNVAHQAAKRAGPERTDLIARIETLEYEVYKLPRPDRVILLDLPVTTARELIARKSPRGYTDRAADLQEADDAYLARVREVYLELAAHRAGWTTVACTRGGELRTVDDIATEVAAVFGETLTG